MIKAASILTRHYFNGMFEKWKIRNTTEKFSIKDGVDQSMV